jgi:hypothetical protein
LNTWSLVTALLFHRWTRLGNKPDFEQQIINDNGHAIP